MNMNGEIKEQGGTHFDPCSSSGIVAAPSDDAALYDAALYAAYSDGRQDERADALLLRLPEPYGQVTTHSQTGQQFFYRWPEPPYLDNASKCVTVYATPAAVSEPAAPVDARDANARRYEWLRERVEVRQMAAITGTVRPAIEVGIGCAFFDSRIPKSYPPEAGIERSAKLDAAIDAAIDAALTRQAAKGEKP